MAERTCALCDEPFKATTPNRIYCSKRCNRIAYNRRYRSRSHNGQTCTWCSETFDATKPAKYCSIECQGEAKRWRYLKNDRCEVEYAECRFCASVFVARGLVVYCSDGCRESDQSLPWVMGWCPVCQSPHMSKRQASTYCSRTCKKRAQADRHNGYDVPRESIFRRDNWKCQLCGKSIPKNKIVPHPKAAVVDHIIPTIEGGSSSPSNLQAAHFLCNSRKAHNVWADGEQLRLIG